jgi:hypothetical protein
VPVSLAGEKPYRLLVSARDSQASDQALDQVIDRRASSASFALTFERLVARVAEAFPAEEIAAMHRAFEERTGAFGPDDAWFESRSRAFWDDAMTRQNAASRVRDALDDEERRWADALPRAHRGLFRSREEEDGTVLSDILSGAELLVHEVDEASCDALASTGAFFDGTVAAVASPARLALLPGAIFHPEEAEDAIVAVVKAARARGVAHATLLDGLLRMERGLRVLSRVKPSYAYRIEALHA